MASNGVGHGLARGLQLSVEIAATVTAVHRGNNATRNHQQHTSPKYKE
jgi:hypothetical protein